MFGAIRTTRRTGAWPLAVVLACVALAFAGRPGVAAAQGTAAVTIFLRGPDGPLSGVALSIGDVTVAGDERGIVRVVLEPGAYDVRARRDGYLPVRVLFRLAAARDTTLILHFEDAPEEVEPILVRSTRGERRIEEEPVRVEVIGREEIEEKLLMTPGSIAMLLNEAMGVRVQETAPALGGASVRIQGQRGRYARVLVDGLPLYGYGGALGPLQIPPMDLAQVEVIKGPASALYGASALAGVVNLISRRPEAGREVLANRTSRGGTDVVFWSSDELGALGYTLLGGLHAQDPSDVDGDGWSELARHRRMVARPRVFWREGASSAMATVGLVVESRTGGGFVAGGDRYDQAVETVRADGAVTGRYALGEALALDVRASFSRTDGEHTFGNVLETTLQETVFGELALQGHLGGHAWVVGTALELSSLRVQPVAGMDFRNMVPAVFVQDEVRALPWLALSASARVDTHAEHGTFFSPRGAVLLGPFGVWTIRLSTGSGFVLPTPLVEEVEEVGFGRLTPPDSLLAERGRSVAADFAAAVGSFEFNATLFSSTIRDAIAFVEPAQPGSGTLVNLAAPTRTRGTELLARVRREPFGLTLFHTYTDAQEPDAGTLRLERMALTPRHAAGVVAVWESHELGLIGFEAYYTGPQRLHGMPADEATPDYFLFGALIERRVGPVRIFVNAENLGNVRLTDDRAFVRAQPSTIGRWTTDVWKPLEGRVVNGGFRVFF